MTDAPVSPNIADEAVARNYFGACRIRPVTVKRGGKPCTAYRISGIVDGKRVEVGFGETTQEAWWRAAVTAWRYKRIAEGKSMYSERG